MRMLGRTTAMKLVAGLMVAGVLLPASVGAAIADPAGVDGQSQPQSTVPNDGQASKVTRSEPKGGTAAPADEPKHQTDSSDAQSGDAAKSGTCALGVSTMAQCFPDPVFRHYLQVMYPAVNSDDAVVTKDWADTVKSLDGDNFGVSGGGFVKDITGIEVFENLESFTSGKSTGFPRVTDYSPMSHLRKLTSVTFDGVGQPSNNGDINRAGLTSWKSENMPELRQVDMTESLFWDASQLAGLTGLTYLNLDHTAIGEDASGVRDLPNTDADKVPRAKDPFKDFPRMFPNLQTLILDDCEGLNEASFEPLAGLHKLITLSMNADSNAIHGTIPAAISRMTSLSELNMEEDDISDVSPLSGLVNLKTLDLGWNKIKDLSSLATLTQLRELEADDQHIRFTKDLVANPNVIVRDSELKNLNNAAVRFTGDAYYHYLDAHEDLPAPRLDRQNVKVTDGQIELIDPHIGRGQFAEPRHPQFSPDIPEPQIIDGELRGGLLCLSFEGDNPGLSGLEKFSFDGELAPSVRSPHVTVDLRGGTLNGQQSPDPIDIVSGHVLGDKAPGRPDWLQANGKANEFLGWKACVVDANGGCSFETATDFDPAKQPIVDDTVLFAHWKSDDARTVFFHQQNGQSNDVITKDVYLGQTVEEPAKPRYGGHEFLGWFTDPASGERYDFKQKITGDLTLYAHWKDVVVPVTSYVVRFDAENGTDHLLVSVKAGTSVARPAEPTLQGYRFTGWYTSRESGGLLYDFNRPVNSDIVLYARWAPSAQANNANARNANAVLTPFPAPAPLIATAPGANSRAATAPRRDTVVQPRRAPRLPKNSPLCETTESKFIQPTSNLYVERFGRVQRADNLDLKCQTEAAVSKPVRPGGIWGCAFGLLLFLLMMLAFLYSRRKLPDYGQHKSPEIYK